MQNQVLHRIYCGDCTEEAKKFITDNSVDLIITDPPYGIQGDRLDRHYHRNEQMVIEGYIEIPQNEYFEFSRKWIAEAERVLRPGGSIYIVSGFTNLWDILTALKHTCLIARNHIIWKYNFGVFTSKKYITSHYHILYYTKPGGQITYNTYARFGSQEKDSHNGSLNYQDREDVWLINREYKPGQKKNKNALPEQLLIKLIQYSSQRGDLVADFFLGGFSTARTALRLDRRVVGFEINKNSFDHYMKEIDQIIPGDLLKNIKNGNNDTPVNQRKRWTHSEIIKLRERFIELLSANFTKDYAIKKLQKEFGRGYFSILNKLSEISAD